jgi:predicted  nucleic acid-binding Zn-ribbon protein
MVFVDDLPPRLDPTTIHNTQALASGELEAMSKIVRGSNGELGAMKAEMAVLREYQATVAQNEEILERNLGELRDATSAALEQEAKAKAEKRALEAELKAQQRDAGRLDEERSAALSQSRDLEATLKSEMMQSKQFVRQTDRLNRDLDQAHQRCERQEAKLREMERQVEGGGALQSENAELQQNVQDLQTALDKSRVEQMYREELATKAMKQEMGEEKAVLMQEIAELRAAVDEAQGREHVLSEEAAVAWDTTAATREELEMERTQGIQVRNQLQAEVEDKTGLHALLMEAQRTVARLEEEVRDEREAYRALREDRNKDAEQVEQLQQALGVVPQQVSLLEDQLQSIRLEQARKADEAAAAHEAEASALRRELGILRGQHTRLAHEAQDAAEQLVAAESEARKYETSLRHVDAAGEWKSTREYACMRVGRLVGR